MKPVRLAVSPSGDQVVSAHSRGGPMLVITDRSGRAQKTIGELEHGAFRFSFARFSHDGSTLAHPNETFSKIILRDATSWDVIGELDVASWIRSGPIHVSAVAFSPDDHRLALSLNGRGVLIYDRDQKTVVTEIPLKGISTCEDLAFSMDGRYLAISSEPITVWDVERDQRLFELSGHTRGLRVMVFVNEGRWLASASRDETLIVWDMTTGDPVIRLGPFDEEVRKLTYDPRTRRLAAGLRSRKVKICACPTSKNSKSCGTMVACTVLNSRELGSSYTGG